jgi:hypothetical protein
MTSLVAGLMVCAVAASCPGGSGDATPGTPAKDPWAGNPDLIPLRDYVLVRFDRNLDELRPPLRFGVFRANEARTFQWIEERFQREFLPGCDKPFGSLVIHYEVPGLDSYNGWWLKLECADWTQFRQWNLVLRARVGEPCTTRFKVELKAKEEGAVQSSVFPYIVNLSKQQLADMASKCFFDVVIPLPSMAGQADLSCMDEFVIVFENTRVDVKKGDLLIHSIRLTPPAANTAHVDANAILDELARNAFLWFEDHRNAKSGLILDRGRNSPGNVQSGNASSIASVGYYLSMLPEAQRAGQIDKAKAEERALTILSLATSTMQHHHGMFHHFVDIESGQPVDGNEVSCLDSAIFFNGCMVAAEAYGGRIAELANTLVDRADWTQFTVKHPQTGKDVLSLGWKARTGLLGPMDVRSSEIAMAYFLAIGSRSHPVDAQCWYNTSVVFGEVGGRKVLNARLPLFTSYYGLGWHALKGLVDKDGVNLDANAREAALANREFCRALGQSSATYREEYGEWWGISAGDSPAGYVAPQLIPGDANGTVWPTAAIAAVPWAPDEIRTDVGVWRSSPLWQYVCGMYGLAPFNVDAGWMGADVIGIDLGSFYINWANHRNETVQQLWMKHPVAKAALERLEYRNASD